MGHFLTVLRFQKCSIWILRNSFTTNFFACPKHFVITEFYCTLHIGTRVTQYMVTNMSTGGCLSVIMADEHVPSHQPQEHGDRFLMEL